VHGEDRPASATGVGSPREQVAALVRERGEAQVVAYCKGLLDGDDPRLDEEALLQLGKGHARWELDHDALDHWPRAWAARAFLYVWSPDVTPSLVRALGDPAWRVAENAMRVMALREIAEGVDAAVRLRHHELPRVRATVVRLVGVAGESDHAHVLLEAVDDPEVSVRAAAERAIERMQRRLDIDLRSREIHRFT
jgi:HEAT repeat protein